MKKEEFEWIHSWCDESLNTNLPRVLLIGDSITHHYQELVRNKLKGIAYVDYISTSYSIDRKIYRDIIKSFVKDAQYDIIHFNHGLHGKYMSQKTYYNNVKKVVEGFNCDKIILALSTIIYKKGNKVLDNSWNKKVEERNEALINIAKENNYKIDDLFSVSKKIPTELRLEDGTHYIDEKNGYEDFANAVVTSIKNLL